MRKGKWMILLIVLAVFLTGCGRGIRPSGGEEDLKPVIYLYPQEEKEVTVPYATDPDHSDVPRSAARPLRYMDRYVTITQGEIMEMTEMLAQLEGIERGPAGQTSLAAAFSLAQDLPEDAILVVSETEYTGAGKHVQPQLWFAKQNGIDVRLGDPKEEVPGKSVVLPASPALFQYKEADIDHFRQSLIKKAVKKAGVKPTDSDLQFLAEETKTDVDFVKKTLEAEGLL